MTVLSARAIRPHTKCARRSARSAFAARTTRAVFCRGDCADAPGLPAGPADRRWPVSRRRRRHDHVQRPRSGAHADRAGASSSSRSRPASRSSSRIRRRSCATTAPVALQLAGRAVRIAAVNVPQLPDVNDRRSPAERPSDRPILGRAASQSDASRAAGEESSGTPPDAADRARRPPLGRDGRSHRIPQIPLGPQTVVAVPCPRGQRPASRPAPRSRATRSSSTAAAVSFSSMRRSALPTRRRNVRTPAPPRCSTRAATRASGMRWGRWSDGTASANTRADQTLNLANASLHWIVGPTFELAPVLPVAGLANFALAGGTNPTDTRGHVGTLDGAVLAADFTAQQVSTTLSLDINGLNWFASGTRRDHRRHRALRRHVQQRARRRPRARRRLRSAGFFSAGAATPISSTVWASAISLVDSLGQLGTVSGVAAFVPGTGQAPVAPVVVARSSRTPSARLARTVSDGLGQQHALRSRPSTRAAISPRSSCRSHAAARASLADRHRDALRTPAHDAATGIRWGRWAERHGRCHGATGAPARSDISGEALHWITGTGYGAAPAIPQTGTASYALVGNTNPTDTLGNVGTLGARELLCGLHQSHRRQRAVARPSAAATGTPAAPARSRGQHAVQRHVRHDQHREPDRGQRQLLGLLHRAALGGGTVAGAGLAYNLVSESRRIWASSSGALAFRAGQRQAAAAAAAAAARHRGDRATRLAAARRCVRDASAEQLRRSTAASISRSCQPLTAISRRTAARTTSARAASSSPNVDPRHMMRWGRWSGGESRVTGSTPGDRDTLDLTQSSLHWVEGADGSQPAGHPDDRHGDLHARSAATPPTDRTRQRRRAEQRNVRRGLHRRSR